MKSIKIQSEEFFHNKRNSQQINLVIDLPWPNQWQKNTPEPQIWDTAVEV
jgi:hypothetical protein